MLSGVESVCVLLILTKRYPQNEITVCFQCCRSESQYENKVGDLFVLFVCFNSRLENKLSTSQGITRLVKCHTSISKEKLKEQFAFHVLILNVKLR